MTVRIDPVGIKALEQQIARHPGMRDIAGIVAEHVKRKDPTGPGGFESTVFVGSDNGTPVVASRDAFAHLIEFGSVNNPPYAPFRTGLREAGLRFADANR